MVHWCECTCEFAPGCCFNILVILSVIPLVHWNAKDKLNNIKLGKAADRFIAQELEGHSCSHDACLSAFRFDEQICLSRGVQGFGLLRCQCSRILDPIVYYFSKSLFVLKSCKLLLIVKSGRFS